MRIGHPVAWMLVGIALGMLAMTSVRAQPQATPAESRRLHYIAVATDEPSGLGAFFIKDTKSGACWLSASNGIAQAPDFACAK
jgi:hypothetical protein